MQCKNYGVVHVQSYDGSFGLFGNANPMEYGIWPIYYYDDEDYYIPILRKLHGYFYVFTL